jgi:hypothetical protein
MDSRVALAAFVEIRQVPPAFPAIVAEKRAGAANRLAVEVRDG